MFGPQAFTPSYDKLFKTRQTLLSQMYVHQDGSLDNVNRSVTTLILTQSNSYNSIALEILLDACSIQGNSLITIHYDEETKQMFSIVLL